MTSHWQLQPIFGSYWVAAVMVGALLLLLLVNPSFGHLSRPRRRCLNLLRALIALLLLVAMLRPTMITTEKRTQTAQLIVLFDASRSMGHRDGGGNKTRWEQQMAMLQSALPKLNDMGESFQVELSGFADQLQPQEKDDKRLAVNAKPIGEETDIGAALLDSVQRSTGKRIAAVILISDGAQRALAPKVPPQQAARQLDRLATPLYTIAIGESRDQSQSRDVAIENLQDEYSVFVKNDFALRVGVRIQGYVNQPVPVTVTIEDDAGETRTLGPLELVATQDSQTVMADFSFRPEKAGQYKIRVKAAGQPGESLTNNQKTSFLNVREGGLRVLLISSATLGEEQKFIRRSLDESQDIELDFEPVSLASQSNWPLDLQAGKTLEEYDVFLIGDVDARAFRPDTWERIAELVDAGGGLMMYGGFHSFGPGGYADTKLADVLPIKMDRFEREADPTSMQRTDRHLQGEIVMLPDQENDSPIMHIAPDAENEQAWRTLKPLDGANKFDKLKDRSLVLARSAKTDPLLVQGTYVSGRVLALATDSTHRWFRFGQQEAHRKFWRQAMLWLARRDGQQANSVFIELPQRRFQARSVIKFTTGLTDEAGDTVPDATLRATLTRPDGSTENVTLSSGNADVEGAMGQIVDTTLAGDYRLNVEALDGTQTITSSYKEFVVEKQDFELADPAANPGLLDVMARMTGRVGGRSVAKEQLGTLLDEIKANPPRDEIETQSRWQLGDTSLDAWSYFLMLVGLLVAEWFLRKRWGLV